MSDENLVTWDPEIMFGKPVVTGTRVTVQSVVERVAAGESVAQIAESHPLLTEEGVRAAIGYAARVLRLDEVYAPSRPA